MLFNLKSFVQQIPIQNIVLHAALNTRNKVALTWSFDSNERNSLAVIERSTDGINFTPLFQKTYLNNNSSQQTFNDATIDAAWPMIEAIDPYDGELLVVLLVGDTGKVPEQSKRQRGCLGPKESLQAWWP